MDEIEYLYSLDLDQLQVPKILASGEVSGRRIEPRDIDLVTEWEVGYSQEALGEETAKKIEPWVTARTEFVKSMMQRFGGGGMGGGGMGGGMGRGQQ